MNFEYYIFRRSHDGYEQTPTEKYVSSLITGFKEISTKEAYVTHRHASLLYYIVFLRDNSKEEYHGICLVVNGVYALSLSELFNYLQASMSEKSARENIAYLCQKINWDPLPAYDISKAENERIELSSFNVKGIAEMTSEYPYVVVGKFNKDVGGDEPQRISYRSTLLLFLISLITLFVAFATIRSIYKYKSGIQVDGTELTAEPNHEINEIEYKNEVEEYLKNDLDHVDVNTINRMIEDGTLIIKEKRGDVEINKRINRLKKKKAEKEAYDLFNN